MNNIETEKLLSAAGHDNSLPGWPDVIAYLVFACYISIVFFIAFNHGDIDFIFKWGALGGVAVWGFIGFRRGIFNEVVSLALNVVPLGVAYVAGPRAGALIGYPNFIGTCMATPVVFFSAYAVTYLMLRPLYNKPRRPTVPGQICGLFWGTGEALVVIAALGFLLSIVPAKNLQMKSSITTELNQVFNSRIQPWLAANASGPTQLLLLVGDKRFTENLKNVDWHAVKDKLAPLARHPKLLPLGNDPELQQMLRDKRFGDFMKHPSITAILTDPELYKISESIDWQSLHSTLTSSMQTKTDAAEEPAIESLKTYIPQTGQFDQP